MKVRLKEKQSITGFKIGDILVSNKGKVAYIVSAWDGKDYRAVLLTDNKVTCVWQKKESLLNDLEEHHDFGEIAKIIKGSDVELIEK